MKTFLYPSVEKKMPIQAFQQFLAGTLRVAHSTSTIRKTIGGQQCPNCRYWYRPSSGATPSISAVTEAG